MLSANNITLQIGNKTLLHSVNLELAAGEFVAIIGPNGAGKSSFIRSITGEVDASGAIMLNGQDWQSVEPNLRARSMAVLPQASTLQFAFTVEEVVSLGRYPHNSGIDKDRQVVMETLRICDAEHLIDRFYPELSGGEKQRVQLARVMAQIWPDEDMVNGKYLLLDEPTNSLDLAHKHQILGSVKKLCNSGTGVLAVLHDLNLAAHYADRIITLHEGRLVEQGSVESVLTKNKIEQIYQCKVLVQEHPETGRPLIIYSS